MGSPQLHGGSRGDSSEDCIRYLRRVRDPSLWHLHCRFIFDSFHSKKPTRWLNLLPKCRPKNSMASNCSMVRTWCGLSPSHVRSGMSKLSSSCFLPCLSILCLGSLWLPFTNMIFKVPSIWLRSRSHVRPCRRRQPIRDGV